MKNINRKVVNLVLLWLVFAIYGSGLWFLSPVQKSVPGRNKPEGGGMTPAGWKEKKAQMEWIRSRLASPEKGVIPPGIRAKELAFAKTIPAIQRGKQAIQWKARGPFNFGGRTRGGALDVNDHNTIIAGGVSGGIWRSTDGGSTWVKRTVPGQLHSVSCLVQDPRPGKTHIWYYGTGEGYGNSASGRGAYFYGDGVYKSTDNGKTWQQLESTSAEHLHGFTTNWNIVWDIAVDPSVQTEDIVYAATYGAVYRTADGGDTWSEVLGDPSGSYFTDLEVTSDGVVYATLSSDGGNGGIWRTKDGTNWVDITPSNWPLNFDRIVIAIDPSNENEVYFLGVTPDYGKLTIDVHGDTAWHSLWKYTYPGGDGTGSNGKWENRSENIPVKKPESFNNFNAQGSYNLAMAVKPDDSNTLFIGGTNVYRSTTAFRDSTHTTQTGGYLPGTELPQFELYPNHHPDQHRFFFLPSDPKVMFTANDGGMYKTQNCMADSVQWQSLNHGYHTTQFYTITINEKKATSTLFGGLQDNGNLVTFSTDPGDPWTLPYNGDGAFAGIPAHEDYYFLSKQRGKILKLELNPDGTRGKYTRVDPKGGEGYIFINPFVLDPNDQNIMYLPAGNKLWRNMYLSQILMDNDFDQTSLNWFQYSDTLRKDREITAITASESPPHRVYYATNKGDLYRVDNAHQGDPTHREVSYDRSPNLYVNCVAVDPEDAGKVFVVYSNYEVYSLFYSRDGGETWEKAAGNLEQYITGTGAGPSFRWLTVLPLKDGKAYFLATSTGLYATDTIKGLNTLWRHIGAETIGNVVVEMVKTRTKDGMIVVGTHGNGVYSGKIESVDQITGEETLAFRKTLDWTLFPNPARGHVNLQFTLKKPRNVTVRIRDVMGRLVQERSKERLETGTHEILINTTGLDNGIYYTSLKTGQEVTTRALVVRR